MKRMEKKRRLDGGKAEKTKKRAFSWGTRGSAYDNGPGKFMRPVGLVIDSNDVIYVSDSGSSRIQCFTLKGTFIDMIGSAGVKDGQFCSPEGLAIGPSDDSIYVAMMTV